MLNMILNERELREARAQISALDAALSSARALEPMIAGLPPEVAAQVMRAMKVERSELSSLVSAYESARDRGDHDALRQRAGADPGLTLIVARIAKSLSQKELAWRLGLKEQQIQRYEADRYSNISLKNYTKIAILLGVNLRAEILDLKEFRGIECLIENVSKSDIKKVLKHGRDNGWFSNEADESELKRFIADNKIAFGSPSLLRTGLNVRDHSDDILLHAWRARVSKRAREIIADIKPQYNPLALTWVPDLVRLSVYDDGPKRAREMMLEHGIILIVEPQIPGLMIDGAAFLEGEIPVIGMTIRKDSVDNFWFTLLHEIAHATLHYRTGLRIGFFDQAEAEAVDEQEAEANSFASNVLIPEERWRRSAARIAKSPSVVERFANELGIHPSIVFGRIRKERDDYSIFSQNIGINKVRNAIIGSF
ncbi:XRE family transcriptional regulator [Bosea lathyri]|uniref:HTH-type transcriptional regulator / antitoxin HigA n=1 Tax=Bosea lathyri TaxID=1036778 RepID=A0A1H6D514_9HYPH|nr:XRE family transcriptional regulator [Bosea lathyri]SEG79865.1 HTH-type transcriptional regulator / antitoxin HigA [Bosea lathyri]